MVAVTYVPLRREGAKAKFNRPVHGARGLFSMAVFVFHVVNSGLATWTVLQIPLINGALRSTEYGVELFFCISGYVIAGTLRRAKSPGAFLEDRAARIYPVLWPTIATIVVLGLVSGLREFNTISFGEYLWLLPANLLALPGIFPFDDMHPAAWSLSYEMAFYLACSGAWWLRLRAGERPARALVILCAGMLLFYPRGVFFLAGLLVAEGYARAPMLRRLASYPVPLLIVFLAAWHGIQLLSPRHISETTLLQWMGDFRFPLAILGFMTVTLGFAGLVEGTGGLGPFLTSRVMQYLGTISYSFYLWHPIVMSVAKHALLRSGLAAAAGPGAQLLFFVVALPPSIVVAHASQLVFERAAANWLRGRLHHPASLETAALAEPQHPEPAREAWTTPA